jgi:hypothetical protein
MLLEWILSIYLNDVGCGKDFPLVFGSYFLNSGDLSAQKKTLIHEIKGISDPHSCSVIVSCAGGKVDAIEYEEVNIVDLLTLSEKKIVPELTLATADRLLRKNGQEGLDEEMKKLSVDQLISKLLSFKGIFLSSADLLSSSCCSLKQFAANHVERIMKTLSAVVLTIPESLITENDHYFYNQKMVLKDVAPVNTSIPSVATSSVSSSLISSVAVSQELLDKILSDFGELQANHHLTLKFFLFQKCFEDDEKAEKLSIALGSFEVTDYDNAESYLYHLQSFIPVGFEEESTAFLRKFPRPFSYKKKINELQKQVNEMINDFQKPFFGIEI